MSKAACGLLLLVLSYLAPAVALASPSPNPPGAAESCVPPPPGIIAWWPFDETSGSLAADFGGDHPGVYFGAPSPTPGQVGGALRFAGSVSGSFVGMADSDLWAFGFQDFTIELWASFAAPGAGSIGHPSHSFVGNDEGPGTRNKWFFALGGGFLNFHINGPALGAHFFPLAPFSPELDRWYHLAVTRTASLYRIFADGEQIAAATNEAIVPNATAFLTIGQAENLGFMNGALDEVTIYNRALTPAELSTIASAGEAGKCKGVAEEGSRIESVTPSSGGNAGDVTVAIKGSGFRSGATVNLVDAGNVILTGSGTEVGGGPGIETTFNLRGQQPRELELVVVNPDGSESAPVGFSIVQGGAAKVTLQIVAPGTVRAGRDADLALVLRNTGNIDALVDLETDLQFPEAAQYHSLQAPQLSMLPPPTVVVPAGGAAIIQMNEKVSDRAVGCVPLRASGTIFFINIEVEDDDDDDDECEEGECKELKRLRTLVLKRISETHDRIALIGRFMADLDCGAPRTPLIALTCERLRLSLREAQKVLANWNTILGIIIARMIECKCKDDENPEVAPLSAPAIVSSDLLREQTDTATAVQQICAVNSWDPNDKKGHPGTGSARFISPSALLSYRIFFENVVSASAPAQAVLISDRLAPDLDWSSVSFGPIRIGSIEVPGIPGQQQHAVITLDLRPERDLLLVIELDADDTTGVVGWRFNSLDPATGQPAADPLAGFLPPNVTAPEGEGSVSFTVAPKAGLLTGAEIRNKGSITFDGNPSIETPEVVNTIDASAPESQVHSLSPIQSTSDFQVQWSGGDEGSGIMDYTILVSVDGGSFGKWIINTVEPSAIFAGEVGRSYSFYSLARDETGNLEAPPLIADATTRIVLDECPNDPQKTSPGVCGCGAPDVDSDGDGALDCLDACPADAGKTEEGVCGCGVEDSDGDDDGIANCADNCPAVPNPEQEDEDGDGIGDACTQTGGKTSFFTVTPCRVFDTRLPPGLPLIGGAAKMFVIGGVCGVPLSAMAVAVNITAVMPTSSGDLTLWPGDEVKTLSSVLSFRAGQARANNAILALPSDGSGTIAAEAFLAEGGTVHLILDVTGFFE